MFFSYDNTKRLEHGTCMSDTQFIKHVVDYHGWMKATSLIHVEPVRKWHDKIEHVTNQELIPVTHTHETP